MRSRFWLWAAAQNTYRARGLMTPPITGDPYSLSLPGQSRGHTVAMWARYLFARWVVLSIALLAVGLAAYPVAMVILWLMLLLR